MPTVPLRLVPELLSHGVDDPRRALSPTRSAEGPSLTRRVPCCSDESGRNATLTASACQPPPEANRAIELLKERRTALISAAVTGQVDVRGMVKAEVA